MTSSGDTANTEPSVALDFRASSTTRPPAPGRFSIMADPAYDLSSGSSSRATTSVVPPGGNPTSMRTGVGIVCAAACRAAAMTPASPAIAPRLVIVCMQRPPASLRDAFRIAAPEMMLL